MECFFAENFDKTSEIIALNIEESRHTKSLRITLNDEILVTNGNGLTALCKLAEISKNGNTCEIIEFYDNLNELSAEITLAVGITENSDRYEFIIEKATELGVKEIVPLITRYSTVRQIRYERLVSKSIAALKQSKRSVLPVITQPVRFEDIADNLDLWDTIVLADNNGKNSIMLDKNLKIIIFAGPEGGFSLDELSKILSYSHTQSIRLAPARLRTETAAISAISTVVFNIPT